MLSFVTPWLFGVAVAAAMVVAGLHLLSVRTPPSAGSASPITIARTARATGAGYTEVRTDVPAARAVRAIVMGLALPAEGGGR